MHAMHNSPTLVARRWVALTLCATSLLLAACGRESPTSLIESGNAFLAKKDTRSAVIQFKAALQAEPNSAQARFLLGRALLESGDPASAVVELTKVMDQRYDDNQVLPPLARALLLSGGMSKLTTLYGDVVLSDKQSQAALKTSLATAWGVLGNNDKAQAALAAALATQPDYPAALILQARIKASQGKFDDALTTVDAVLAKDKDNYEAWNLKGEILAGPKQDDKAAELAFKQSLAAEKAFIPAHLGLIALRLKAHDLPGAKAQAAQMHAVLPKHPQTMFVEARLALIDNDFKTARELTQQLLRIAPDNVGVLQLAGLLEERAGSLVVAETHFSKALQLNPQLPLARRQLAKTYLRQGQPAKALQTLEPMRSAQSTDGEALAVAGEAQLQLGDANAAESLFRRASKLSPDNPQLRTALALMTLSHGEVDTAFNQLNEISAASTDTAADMAILSARLKRKEYDAALRALDVMAKKQPKSANVEELRGFVYVAKNDLGAARAAYEKALLLEPSRFSVTASLAALDVKEGKKEQARKRLQAAIDADPRNTAARIALADLRTLEGAPLSEVVAVLSDGIKAAPTIAAPRVKLMDLLIGKKQYQQALAASQDAVAALPDNPDVLDAAGRAQMLAGDSQQAVSTFRKLGTLEPKSARAQLRLAELLLSTGNRDGAVNSLRRALEIEPNLAAAQVRLMDILSADGRSKEALEMARNMQQQTPTSPAGYLLEGAIQHRMKADAAAEAAYRAGLKHAANKSELATELHKTLLSMGQAPAADRFAASWTHEHPDDDAFQYHLATVSILRNQLPQAESQLRQFLAKHPNHPMALNNMAWVLASQGKAGATAYAQKANEMLPNRPALMDTLAMALAADKQYAKALEVQKKAIDISPGDMGLRFNLAKIQIQAGDKASARPELERLAAMGSKLPYHNAVDKLLKSL
jgi:putative PEP-CTERM system TPR-repeat lipoprotein